MTEIERIKSKGVIPKSFWEEETRLDYRIDSRMKKIWGVQLDLLFEIDRVCKKYGITYYAMGGTLLGAVRHKGFIPWDDDIDIAMPRKHYNIFCDVCTKEISSPYFIQTTDTENDCHCDFARICNSNTTGIRSVLTNKQNVNKGIFVDIFPLDALYNSRMKRFILKETVHARVVVASAYSFNINPSRITKVIHKITTNGLVKYDLRKWDRKTERLLSSPNWDLADEIAIAVRLPFNPKRRIWKKECFDSVIMVPFEFFEVPIPVGFDYVLTVLYGDYMVFPPIEERGKWHSDVVFNPEMSYIEYEEINEKRC